MINVQFELESMVCGNGFELMMRKLRGLPINPSHEQAAENNQLRYGFLTGVDRRQPDNLNKGTVLVNGVYVFRQDHYTSKDELDLPEALLMANYFKHQGQLAGVVAVHPRGTGSKELDYTRVLRCLLGRAGGPNVSLSLVDDSNLSVFIGDQYEFTEGRPGQE